MGTHSFSYGSIHEAKCIFSGGQETKDDLCFKKIVVILISLSNAHIWEFLQGNLKNCVLQK